MYHICVQHDFIDTATDMCTCIYICTERERVTYTCVYTMSYRDREKHIMQIQMCILHLQILDTACFMAGFLETCPSFCVVLLGRWNYHLNKSGVGNCHGCHGRFQNPQNARESFQTQRPPGTHELPGEHGLHEPMRPGPGPRLLTCQKVYWTKMIYPILKSCFL